MKTLTLNDAEIRMLQIILEAYHAELAFIMGQDLTVDVNAYDALLFARSADTFNFDDIQVVDRDTGEFNLMSGVSHFLEKIESVGG